MATTALVAVHGYALQPVPAFAQTSSAESGTVRAYNIPAQPLASALNALGRQSGLQVTLAASTSRGVTSRAVSGRYTPQQALTQMLEGTGIPFRITSDRTAIVGHQTSNDSAATVPGAIQLDQIDVQGAGNPNSTMTPPPPYPGGQVATGGQLGLLGNRSVMDTPFNQTNFTAKKIQDQQAKTIQDVLIDDPSARAGRAPGTVGNDFVYIRGFQTSVSYGGLFGMLPELSIMSELADRVEVLKGPSAMLNGMPPNGAIGGTINIVPKRAPDEDLTQLTTNYLSAAQFGGHLDFARRFGSEKQFGMRFNGVYRGGETAVESNADERALGVLGLDFRGERVRLSADFGYQNQDIKGVITYPGLAAGVPLPPVPNARINQGQPWAYINRYDLFGTARAEIDLTDRVTAYAAVGGHASGWKGLYSTNATINNINGNAVSDGPLSRNNFVDQLTGETGLRASIDTGPISHDIAIAASTYEMTAGFDQLRLPGTDFATNIYNPTIIPRPNIITPTPRKTTEIKLSGLALADTLSIFDKRIQLTLGARLQQVEAVNFDRVTGALTSSYDESALSPSVALVVKPWQNVSIYGNYIQGLQQGTIVGPTFANAGEVFPPFQAEQYETGVKVDWGQFTTTVSLFQITQPSTISVPGTGLPSLQLAGEQRNRGLEFNVFGELMPGVRLLGGVMLLDPRLTKTPGGLTDGWIAPFSPRTNFNLGGEWDLPFVPGLTLTGRAVYTSSQYIDTTSPRRAMPAWTRYDLGARYTFDNPAAKGKKLVARFSVENLLDDSYWAGGVAANQLVIGAPRTFRLSLTADF